jgi:N-acetylglucosamine malate deacetylase 1
MAAGLGRRSGRTWVLGQKAGLWGVYSMRALRQALRSGLWKALSHLKAARTRRWLNRLVQAPAMKMDTKPTMVFAPHQDDETFGCGGLIALKRQAGVAVVVVFLTDGSRSHGADPDLDLAKRRRQEAHDALAILGVAAEQVHFLDLPDSGLFDLAPERRRMAVEQLARLLEDFAPKEVYVPHQADRHRDHEAAHALVCDALGSVRFREPITLWQYPIWLLWEAPLSFDLDRPELAKVCRLTINPVLEHKQKAIGIYSSQTGDGGSGVLPPGFTDQFLRSFELYFGPDIV